MSDKNKFIWILGVFALAYWLPVESPGVRSGAVEAMAMLHEYAREHVLLCLVPAFFIAGAISVFVSQQAVMKYLGAQAKKWVAYSVAAVSGTILAVCSCTVLPLFAGIYKRGAGLGPATAFLYSGPAINVLSIVLTARVLGFKLGLARAVGAILFSVLIGVCMAFIFRGEEEERQKGFAQLPDDGSGRALWKTVWHMASMVVFLVFANWAAPKVPGGVWESIYSVKWYIAAAAFLSALGSTFLWFQKDERQEVDGLNLRLLTSGVASAVWGSVGRWIPAWTARPRGTHTEPVGRVLGRWQFLRSQLLRRRIGSIYVLRHTYGGSNTSGTYRIWHGTGSRPCPSPSGTGPVTAQHAGHKERHRDKKDRRLRQFGGDDVHRNRNIIRLHSLKETRKALSQRRQGLSLLGGLKPYGDVTPIQGKGNRIQRHEKDLPQGGLYPAVKGVVPAILQNAGAIY